MAGRIQDKVCIITGASSGIGAAAARLFAEEGGKLVLAARRDKTQKIVDEIRAAGGEAIFVKTDVLHLEDIDHLIEKTIETYGRIDVFYGNAGVGSFFAIEDMDIEKDFEYIVNTFMRANWWAAKKILPYMIRQGKGDFIFTTSTAGYEGVAPGSIYSAGKAAIHRLSAAIAAGYGKYDIRSNCVVPALITTELSPAGGAMEEMQLPYIPMARPGQAREVAYAALFFASDECRYATGDELVVAGGVNLAIQYPAVVSGGVTNDAFNIGEGGVTTPIG